MAAPVYNRVFTQDITQKVETRHGGGLVFNGNNGSMTLGVRLFNGGEPLEISGTVTGQVMLSDGSTALTENGTIAGNLVSVTLNKSCFAVEGPIVASISVTDGGVKTTVLRAAFTVALTSSGPVIDPGQVVPDVDDIVAQYGKMQRVTAEAEAAAGTALSAASGISDTQVATFKAQGAATSGEPSLIAGGININGTNNDTAAAKRTECRMGYRGIGTPLLLTVDSAEYQWIVWIYSNITVGSRMRCLTNDGFSTGPVVIPNAGLAKYFRIGFKRLDGDDITEEMRTALAAQIHFWALTDPTLTTSGAAADAKTVGDIVSGVKHLALSSYVAAIGSGDDLDDYTTPGEFMAAASTSATLSNCPTSVDMRLTVEAIASNIGIAQTVVDAQGATYFRSKATTWGPWKSVGRLLQAPGSDCTSVVRDELVNSGYAQLGAGDFVIEGLDMPEFTRITGVGTATRIVCQTAETLYAIRMRRGCSLDNLQIVGPRGDNYSAASGNGTVLAEHGIYVNGIEGTASDNIKYRINVSNVTICGFAGGAICLDATGGASDNSLNVNNIFIHRCTVGVNIPTQSEYHRFTNLKTSECYYGAVVNGGNNIFTNCGFVRNTVGLQMNSGTNDSHGSFIGCTFNHSGENTGKAIELTNLGSGEMFVGCQIFYGSVHVTNCHGIVFDACNFGNTTPITVTGGRLVMFTNCVSVGASQTPVTVTNNTLTKLINCYSRGGTEWEAITT